MNLLSGQLKVLSEDERTDSEALINPADFTAILKLKARRRLPRHPPVTDSETRGRACRRAENRVLRGDFPQGCATKGHAVQLS